jgi:hypothetical protein
MATNLKGQVKADWMTIVGLAAGLGQLGAVSQLFYLTTPTWQAYFGSLILALIMLFFCWQYKTKAEKRGVSRERALFLRGLGVLYGCLFIASLSPAAYRWAYKNLPWFDWFEHSDERPSELGAR